jgi:hypothetical protein
MEQKDLVIGQHHGHDHLWAQELRGGTTGMRCDATIFHNRMLANRADDIATRCEEQLGHHGSIGGIDIFFLSRQRVLERCSNWEAWHSSSDSRAQGWQVHGQKSLGSDVKSTRSWV